MSLKPTPARAVELDLEPGQVDHLEVAGEGAPDPRPGVVALDRGEEADGAEVDAEDGDPGAGEVAQRVEDRAVAAEDEAEVEVARKLVDRLDALCCRAVLGDLVGGGEQPTPGLRGRCGGELDRVGRRRRVRVGDQRGFVVMLPPPRGPLSDRRSPRRLLRTRRRSRGSPSAPAGRRRRSRAPARPSSWAQRATERIASRRSSGSRTTPLPTRSRPSSNCGLTIARISPPGAMQRASAGRIFVSEMNETSTVVSAGRERQVGRLQAAGVEALDHGHPGILAQAQVDLSVGDVERDDPRRAALQQAVGEAAGRGADVEAVAPGRPRRRASSGRYRA